MLLVFWRRQRLVQSIVFHLYFSQNWTTLQCGLSAIAELLVDPAVSLYTYFASIMHYDMPSPDYNNSIILWGGIHIPITHTPSIQTWKQNYAYWMPLFATLILRTFAYIMSRRDLDLWPLDLELLQVFGCHAFKRCTKFEQNRIIHDWVIDDLELSQGCVDPTSSNLAGA